MAKKLKLKPQRKIKRIKKSRRIYPDDFIGKVICGHNVDVLCEVPDDSIDLVVTSPPYDKLRNYDGYKFEFEKLAAELYRVATPGGAVVWVVGDETKNFSESMTSFRQALKFNEIGFRLNDTMIFVKVHSNSIFDFRSHKRYIQRFEYMFVFSKGKPGTFNPLFTTVKKKDVKKERVSMQECRRPDGSMRSRLCYCEVMPGKRLLTNVWKIPSGGEENLTKQHPATFPEELAKRHILTWSNSGDIVLDPMCGSGTTLKMAKLYRRKFIGIDVSEKYCKIARTRVRQVKK